MKLIVETHSIPLTQMDTGLEIVALLVPASESVPEIRDTRQAGLPIFYRGKMGENARKSTALDAPDGQVDLDRMSAELRVYEAQNKLRDRATQLILFPYPDAASLADRRHTLIGSERLFALALDDAQLLKSVTGDDALTGDALPAPLLYARARLIGAGRALGVPSFIKPIWGHDLRENLALLHAAKRDGFDGVIAPPAVIASLNNV